MVCYVLLFIRHRVWLYILSTSVEASAEESMIRKRFDGIDQ